MVRNPQPKTIPSISQEIAIQDLWNRAHRTPARLQEIARTVKLPLPLVRSVIRWHAARKRSATCGGPSGPNWYGEREVLPGKVVRCQECHASLAVHIPGHPCRACRMKEHLHSQGVVT